MESILEQAFPLNAFSSCPPDSNQPVLPAGANNQPGSSTQVLSAALSGRPIRLSEREMRTKLSRRSGTKARVPAFNQRVANPPVSRFPARSEQ